MLTTIAPPAASRMLRPSGVIRYAPSARSIADGSEPAPGTNAARRAASVSMAIAHQNTAASAASPIVFASRAKPIVGSGLSELLVAQPPCSHVLHISPA